MNRHLGQRGLSRSPAGKSNTSSRIWRPAYTYIASVAACVAFSFYIWSADQAVIDSLKEAFEREPVRMATATLDLLNGA